MENDMRKALLNKKSGAFDKQFEQCLLKVQKMKQKNDFMQKQVGTDGQQTIRREVTKHEQFIEKQVKQLKSLMESMDKNYKDPESKNKLRTLKADAQKQIERNKTIMREFINKSFLKLSRGALNQQQDASRYMEGGKVSYKHFGDDKKGQTSPRKRQTQQGQQNKMKADSLLTDQYMDMNFQVERKMLQQKKALLDEVEQTSYRVNQIINDMAIMVDEQGQNLDIISEELMKSNKNLVLTNQELNQASKLQRKSRKKYIVFAIILIALIGAGVGFFFFIN